jgi:hypothetical protein
MTGVICVFLLHLDCRVVCKGLARSPALFEKTVCGPGCVSS